MELTQEDKFMVLACDGVWDVMDNQAACDFISPRISRSRLMQCCLRLLWALCRRPAQAGHALETRGCVVAVCSCRAHFGRHRDCCSGRAGPETALLDKSTHPAHDSP